MKDSEKTIKQTTFEELLEQNDHIVYTNMGRNMMPLLRQCRDIIESQKKGLGCARQLSKDNFYAGDDDGTIETLIIPETEHGSL